MKFLSLVLSVALLAGCNSIGRAIIEEPKITLDHVKLSDTKLDGTTVLFGIKVMNPNPFRIKVDEVRYDVDIAGKRLSSGFLKDPPAVEAKETKIVEIPVSVKYSEVFSSLLDLMKNNKSEYRVTGYAGLGPVKVPFNEKGELKLRP